MIYKNLSVSCLLLFFFNTSFAQSQKTLELCAEQQGMNSLILANAIKHFKQDSINIHSVVIIKTIV